MLLHLKSGENVPGWPLTCRIIKNVSCCSQVYARPNFLHHETRMHHHARERKRNKRRPAFPFRRSSDKQFPTFLWHCCARRDRPPERSFFLAAKWERKGGVGTLSQNGPSRSITLYHRPITNQNRGNGGKTQCDESPLCLFSQTINDGNQKWDCITAHSGPELKHCNQKL